MMYIFMMFNLSNMILHVLMTFESSMRLGIIISNEKYMYEGNLLGVKLGI
jgi:hypothetical protein